jgi:hypothetical protein
MNDPGSDRLIEVNSWKDVPAFASEAEEADFWASHSFGPGLTAEAEAGTLDLEDVLPPPRGRTVPVSLRFEPSTINRLKALARRRNTGYQTLAKEFIAERLYEEEKREGIIGDSRAS